MKKVAIITNRAGGGHISLTKGMIDAIKMHIQDDIEVQVFDPTPDVFPFAYAILTSWKLQFLWGILWKWCDNMFVAKLIHRLNYSARKTNSRISDGVSEGTMNHG